MRSGWRIGSIFGIPLLIDPSWFVILLGVTYVYGDSWQAEGWEPRVAWSAGLITALALFGSVLLHELGHSLVARSQGIKVNSITLFLFGGIASIDQESKTPGKAFQVAIAGPAVSFFLFLALNWLGQLVAEATATEEVINNLAGINLVLSVFNMIPGLPLDGGLVLKAAIWKATGSRIQGVRWAARVGLFLGWMAVLLGVSLFLQFKVFSLLWIALLGWFGIRNASAYNSITDLQEALLSLTAAGAMTRDFRVVDAGWTLRQFADHCLVSESNPALYFAASDGRYRGMVRMDDLRQIERSLWDKQTLHDLAQPLDKIPSVPEVAPLTDVIESLEAQALRQITVLSPAGAVAGTVDRGDIVRAIAEKLKYPIAPTVIQRIKEEGVYPPGLPLQAIAKSARN